MKNTCFSWLFCLSGILSAAAADRSYFNVRDFGAVGDGKTPDHPAINRAIDAAVAAGGGTVFLPAGTYLSGSIHLRSNLRLFLDAGATILGAPQSLNAYDETEPYSAGGYQDGGHCYFHNSLIWGENLTNVFITGHGLINGGGLQNMDTILDQMCGHLNWQHPDQTPTNLPPVRLGNKAIALKLCKNVLIRDITIVRGGHFAILFTGCDNLTVDNVTLDTNRDGIDIDCCRNTMISNCRINAPGDDGLCIKSSYALGEIRLTENLTIVNCQLSGFAEGTLLDGTMKPTSKLHFGRIKFGSESSGGYRNCTIAHFTFRSCRGLALEENDGGILENISINNLTMSDMPEYAIYISASKRNRTPELKTNSRIRNILISNVIADGVGNKCGVKITGLPEQSIEGIRLENIRLTSNGGATQAHAARMPKVIGGGDPTTAGMVPAYGIYARHVRDLELANIHVNFVTNDFRPAAMFADIQGLEIDNFKPQVADGVKAAVFADNVVGITIRNSPALQK